jgi:hypothetical protein
MLKQLKKSGNNTRKITKVYFSLGINNQANQNKVEPPTRKKMKPKASMYCGITAMVKVKAVYD